MTFYFEPPTDQLIQRIGPLTVAQPTFDFTAIPATFSHLLIIWQARSTRASVDNIDMRFNASAGPYQGQKLDSSGAVTTSSESLAGGNMNVGDIPGANSVAAMAGSGVIWIPNYAGTTFDKTAIAHAVRIEAAFGAGAMFIDFFGNMWNGGTAAINEVSLKASAGPNFAIGSMAALYGLL